MPNALQKLPNANRENSIKQAPRYLTLALFFFYLISLQANSGREPRKSGNGAGRGGGET